MSLTPKQRRILDAIVYLIGQGDVPTVREVGALVGLRSPATVLKHLRALEAGKLIEMSGRSRGIRIVDTDLLARIAGGDGPAGDEGPGDGESDDRAGDDRAGDEILRARYHAMLGRSRPRPSLPVVGAIAAGRPIETRPEAFQPSAFEAQPSLVVDPQLFASSGELFALRVEGDSMVGAGILDGDYAIIRRQNEVEEGEIAAVLVNGEATLKRWHLSRDEKPSPVESDARREPQDRDFEDREFEDRGERLVRLTAANERFEPLEITELDKKEVLVVGKYVGLVRGARTS